MLYECVKSGEIELDKSNELIGLKKVLDNHKSYLKTRQEVKEEEYLEFLSFLSDKEAWEQELILIKKVDWDRFYNGEDEEIKISGWVQASEFYDMIKELFGIEFKEFEQCFVSAEYIDGIENRMMVVVRIDSIDEEFIVDVA